MRYQVLGKPVQCQHCQGMEFRHRRIMLNTRIASFFDFDWANKNASAMQCERCSQIQWFQNTPEEIR